MGRPALVPRDAPDAGFIADLPQTRTLVLYGQGDLEELPEAASRFEGPVRVLEGGCQGQAGSREVGNNFFQKSGSRREGAVEGRPAL